MFSEQDVDRELKAALSVSPTPDFEARVLRRIAVGRGLETPALRGARIFLAAAASVVIIAGLFYALNRTPVIVPPTAPQIVDNTPPPAPAAMPPELMPGHKAPAHTNTSEPPRVHSVQASRRSPRIAEPEVIVPVNQMEAVRRLVRAVNEGRLDAPAATVEAPVVLLKDVAVAPLVVDPIPVPAVEPAVETPSPVIRGH